MGNKKITGEGNIEMKQGQEQEETGQGTEEGKQKNSIGEGQLEQKTEQRAEQGTEQNQGEKQGQGQTVEEHETKHEMKTEAEQEAEQKQGEKQGQEQIGAEQREEQEQETGQKQEQTEQAGHGQIGQGQVGEEKGQENKTGAVEGGSNNENNMLADTKATTNGLRLRDVDKEKASELKPKKSVDEKKLLRTIVSGSDWQTVIAEIIEQEEMDPWAVDVIKLTDAFVKYMHSLKKFDFKIPARFILIAAILLRMKVELLMEKEEKEIAKGEEQILIDLDKVPPLGAPGMRKAVRKVTLSELINALNKAFAFQEKKEISIIHRHRMVENLIEKEEDIEEQIMSIMKIIVLQAKDDKIMFSSMVPDWSRGKAIAVFLPLLHLANRAAVALEQEKMYSDFAIIKLDEKKAMIEEHV